MKIECNKKDLVSGINTVSRAVPVRTTMPVMSCILINADENGIMLTANDLELGVRTKVEGTVEENGKAALNAKLLADIAKKLPEGTITVQTGDNAFESVVSCGKASYRISGMDAEQFPAFPELDGNYRAEVPQNVLKDMIRQTAFSIADVDTNKMMTGELLEIRDGILSITSLEGHRISIRNYKMLNKAENRKAIIPGKAMVELTRIMNGGIGGMADIRLGKTIALFEFDGTSVAARMIDGNYFNVDQMISSEYKTKVTVDRADLAEAVDRSLPLLSDGMKVPFIETIEDGKLSMQMRSGIGTLDDELPVDKEGEDLKIGFNPRYLLDVLNAVDDEKVAMYYSGRKSPCIIKDENENFIYLVLPVNFVD